MRRLATGEHDHGLYNLFIATLAHAGFPQEDGGGR